jgi:hypothetical protein
MQFRLKTWPTDRSSRTSPRQTRPRECSRLVLKEGFCYNLPHEVDEDPLPRRRVRISGPIYGDSNVPFLRIEFEGGNAELIPGSEMRRFRPLPRQQIENDS